MGEQSFDSLDGCFSLTIASRIPTWTDVMVELPVCCKLSEEFIGKLGAIVRPEYFSDAMFCKEFLQDWDGLGGITLRCRDSSEDWHLGVVVSDNRVFTSIKVKVVSAEELPWAIQGQCWLQQLSWFLWVVMLAHWAWFNETFDVWVDFRPIHSVWLYFGTCWFPCVQHTLLGGSSPFMIEEWWELHLEGWGHLQLWGCFCGYGMGVEHVGHHWYHLANLLWLSQQGSGREGHLGWEPGTQFFCWVWCAHGWWWCLEVSLEPTRVHNEGGHCNQYLFARLIFDGHIIVLEL